MNTFNLFLISSTNIFNNIKDFFSSLTIIDVTFFFAVLFLMIVVVTLLYFIKVNEEVKEKDEIIEELTSDQNSIKENKEEAKYYDDDEEGELLDLESITKALENKTNDAIDLTTFEEEQEKDAIISYDELINKTNFGTINYKNESMYDDLSVKEVDLDHLINETDKSSVEVTKTQVISYAQEEAFLEALKKLQKQIN
jgi:Ca2+/Na+ antiporter